VIALFFDTETTGIKTPKNPGFIPRLVQMGAILQDLDTGRVLGEINLIANQTPLSIIPEGAIAVHGITNDMAKEYGVDPNLIDLLFGMLVEKADILVAHNIDYDTDVIQDNFTATLRVLQETPKPLFCTMRNNVYIVKAPLTDKQKVYFSSKGILPDYPYKVPNLTETYKHYFGKQFDGAHDAMADIRACRDIFLQMLEQGWIETDPAHDAKVLPSAKLFALMPVDDLDGEGA
jgi:DNA polymerase III subunit epsilon